MPPFKNKRKIMRIGMNLYYRTAVLSPKIIVKSLVGQPFPVHPIDDHVRDWDRAVRKAVRCSEQLCLRGIPVLRVPVAQRPFREARAPAEPAGEALDQLLASLPAPPPRVSSASLLKDSDRQRRFGASKQLIIDGICDPFKHFAMAKRLAHPFDEALEVDDMVEDNLRWLREKGSEALRSRIQFVATLRQKASELEPERVLEKEQAGGNFAKMDSPLHLPLMRWLGNLASCPDHQLPSILAIGLPIVGQASESPFFTPGEVPPKMSVLQLLQTAKARRGKIIASMQKQGSGGDLEAAKKVYDKTLEEVTMNQMSGPFTAEEIQARQGPFWNGVRRFPIRQGLDVSGAPKIRAIDDHTESANN